MPHKLSMTLLEQMITKTGRRMVSKVWRKAPVLLTIILRVKAVPVKNCWPNITRLKIPKMLKQLVKQAQEDPHWRHFHLTSYDNPYIRKEDLDAERERYKARGEEDTFVREFLAEHVPGSKRAIFGIASQETGPQAEPKLAIDSSSVCPS